MKAAVCRAFRAPLQIESLALAAPGPGEVRVRVRACAICHSDLTFIDGGWGGTLPAVYGHEAAGVVEETGPGVTDLAPGDRVVITMVRACGTCPCCAAGLWGCCEGEFALAHHSPLSTDAGAAVTHGLKTGAFAEAAVVDRSQLVRIDAPISFEAASLLACGVITGYGAVANTARLPAGANAVVIGTGGVGLNAVQGARILGANRVIAVDLSDEKLAAAELCGATDCIRADGDVGAEVRALTGGRGADYVFVAAGAPAAINGAYALIAKGGAVVLVGIPATGVTSVYDPGTLADSAQRILGSKLGASDIQADIPALIGLYREGRLKLDELISARHPFERINDALDAARRGQGIRQVVVMEDAP